MIAYSHKGNRVWAGAVTQGQKLLNRTYKFGGFPYESGGLVAEALNAADKLVQ